MGRIILDIADNHKYKDLALLFDRQDFQRDLEELARIIGDDYKKHSYLGDFLQYSKGYDAARLLTRKYRYSIGFTRAIYSAACYGKVTDRDVVNCYSKVLMSPMSELDSYNPVLTKADLVIFIDPHAIHRNKASIVDDIKHYLDSVLRTVEFLPQKHPLNLDVRSNIREVREWYWERVLYGTSTLEMVEKYHHEPNTIDKAISQYSKLLQTEL